MPAAGRPDRVKTSAQPGVDGLVHRDFEFRQRPAGVVGRDQTGVGQLVEMACEKGRAVRSDLKLGICGEHGGEPSSVEFCHRTGLDYVSCSPFRVPIARLAAAHASLEKS